MPQRKLLTISLFFVLNLLLVSLTFYNSFQRIISGSRHYSVWITVHAFALAAWVLLLFIQPLLIYANKFKWHRQLGMLSIGLVALIIVTTIASSAESFFNLPGSYRIEKKYSVIFSQVYGILLFGFLYTRALLKAKVFTTHVQYIMASLVVILGPVIFRTTYTFQISLCGTIELTCNVFTYSFLNALLLVLCIIDLYKKESAWPYFFTLLALIPIEISQIWFSLPEF